MKRITAISFLFLMAASSFALGTAQQVALYCKGQKLPLSQRLNLVKMVIPVVETGTNSILFTDDSDDMIRFSFQDRDYTSFGGEIQSAYTASFNRYDFFNNDVIGYRLAGSGTLKIDRDYNLDKFYEVYSFEQNIEAYHQDGQDLSIIEIVNDPASGYSFKMMLDGGIYGEYAGDYAVNCYLATYL